jgi:hypothetical protein
MAVRLLGALVPMFAMLVCGRRVLLGLFMLPVIVVVGRLEMVMGGGVMMGGGQMVMLGGWVLLSFGHDRVLRKKREGIEGSESRTRATPFKGAS